MTWREWLALLLLSTSCADAKPLPPNAVPQAGAAGACPALMAIAVDGGDQRCRGQRYWLSCRGGLDGGMGIGLMCLSDDPSRCAGAGTATPGVEYTCRSVCPPTDYGVVCGGIGPWAPSSAPPRPECHSMGATPGGIVFYCCPCSP